MTELQLSIVQLDQSIHWMDLPVASAITRILDQHSCITVQDAVPLLFTPSSTTTTTSTTTISCTTKLLESSSSSSNIHRKLVEKSILRYIRDTDRWMALTSLLLKSLAWYRSLMIVVRDNHSSSSSLSCCQKKQHELRSLLNIENQNIPFLPIIDLPRTKYNRPYLPYSIIRNLNEEECHAVVVDDDGGAGTEEEEEKKDKEDNNNNMETITVHENRLYLFNISHQYPWVCMVQFHPPSLPSYYHPLPSSRRIRRRRKTRHHHLLLPQLVQNNKHPSSRTATTTMRRMLGIDVVTFHVPPIHYSCTHPQSYNHKNITSPPPPLPAERSSIVHDYISSFRHCFTSWEWERIVMRRTKKEKRTMPIRRRRRRRKIPLTTRNTSTWDMHCGKQCKKMTTRIVVPTTLRQRSEESILKEFYLRWSMKEAYTKAMGLGMNMDFHKSEIRLCGIDDEEDEEEEEDDDDSNIINNNIMQQGEDKEGGEEGIWTAITNQMIQSQSCDSNGKTVKRENEIRQKCSFFGRIVVVHHDVSPPCSSSSSSWTKVSKSEEWEFIFVPLLDQHASHETTTTTTTTNDSRTNDYPEKKNDDGSLALGCVCICFQSQLVHKKERKLIPSSLLSSTTMKKRRLYTNCIIESLSLSDIIDFHK